MPREVRGILFVDPVRMLRATKGAAGRAGLSPQDEHWLSQRIDPEGWYPMDAYERLSLAVLDEVAKGDLTAVREWGRQTFEALRSLDPRIVEAGDPRELFFRFQLLRQSLFNFPAVEVVALREGAVLVELRFGLTQRAEEAAAAIAIGILESLVASTGAEGVEATVQSRSWKGEGPSRIAVAWRV